MLEPFLIYIYDKRLSDIFFFFVFFFLGFILRFYSIYTIQDVKRFMPHEAKPTSLLNRGAVQQSFEKFVQWFLLFLSSTICKAWYLSLC